MRSCQILASSHHDERVVLSEFLDMQHTRRSRALLPPGLEIATLMPYYTAKASILYGCSASRDSTLPIRENTAWIDRKSVV